MCGCLLEDFNIVILGLHCLYTRYVQGTKQRVACVNVNVVTSVFLSDVLFQQSILHLVHQVHQGSLCEQADFFFLTDQGKVAFFLLVHLALSPLGSPRFIMLFFSYQSILHLVHQVHRRFWIDQGKILRFIMRVD